MKLLLYSLLFIYTSVFSQNIDMNLKRFAELVSSQNQINIIISNDIEFNNISFFIQNNKDKIMLPAFQRMLSLKGLALHYDDNFKFYFIEKIKLPKKRLHTIKLDTLVYDDMKNLLSNIDGLKFSYIKNSNSIVLYCKDEIFNSIKFLVNNNDDIQEQFQLKITILDTNLNNVEERGVELSVYNQSLDGSIQHFVNLVTLPSSAISNVFDGSSTGINASLKYLNSIGVTKIESSPFVTVQSGKEVYFSSVENIPYKISQSNVNGASQSSTQSVEYKDVGLKINLTPKIINDICFIDLNFVVEVIIDKSDTPSTAKRELKNSFQLRKGQLLVLSGISQTTISSNDYSVPYISNIPFLGSIFQYKTHSSQKRNLSIMIEII